MNKDMYGDYGGRFVPKVLENDLDKVEKEFEKTQNDPEFQEELKDLRENYVGRPTPLYFAENATKQLGGAKVYLKMEGLAHSGAHKINNAIGQGLLAKRLGKKKLIAETGAGQHGLASATIAAKLGLECDIFMGAKDYARQRPNVFWMETLGAKVYPVISGTQTLTDAVEAAYAAWSKEYSSAHYLVGSALGPAPYPRIVKEFQSIIGAEVKEQSMEKFGRLPDCLVACAGGGSNAMGLFSAFLTDENVRKIAVEGGGRGPGAGQHAVRFKGRGSVAEFHGYRSVFLHDGRGNLLPTHSVSAGLDYAGIGPELAYLHDKRQIEFSCAMDSEVLQAVSFFAKNEGIIPALESSHALACVMKLAPRFESSRIIVANVSGRGDKDLFITAPELGDRKKWAEFLRDEARRLS